MGKYQNSKLHEAYSEWHWQHKDNLLQDCYLTDVDRIWIEIRSEKPKIVCDLKFENDNITYTEQILYQWFLEKGLEVFLLTPIGYDKNEGKIDKFSSWKIVRFKDGKTKILTCKEYCDWLKTFQIPI